MFTFFIILLSLVVINVFLLLFSLSTINKSTDKLPEFYVYRKHHTKVEKESPAYSVYKKAI